MPSTTLSAIRAHEPCADGWRKLLAHLGKLAADDEPLDLLAILDSNGLDDALWCLRAMPQHARHWRLYAVACARDVQHLLTDPRSVAALDVAERHACGEATDEELRVAGDAARDAWVAARDAARVAAGVAARAAARVAAWDAGAAALAAAWDAAWVAAWAARAARAARAAAIERQTLRLRELCAEIDAEAGVAA